MNYKRDCYDEKLEEIICRNEYIIDPYEVRYKPSSLEYNRKNMKPILPHKLSGFERVVAESFNAERRRIKRLNEYDCMELLRKLVFPDIYKISTDSETDYDRIDYHVPSFNIYIDHKERGEKGNRTYYEEDGGMTLDKPKYDELMKEENGYILNSCNNGLFMWNVKLLGDLEWRDQDKTPVSTKFAHGKGKTERCLITDLSFRKCNDLTYLLLQEY